MEDRRFKIEDVGGDDDVDDYRACEDWLAVATTINLQPQGGGHPPKLKQFCKTGEKVIGQHRGKTGGWVVGVKEETGPLSGTVIQSGRCLASTRGPSGEGQTGSIGDLTGVSIGSQSQYVTVTWLAAALVAFFIYSHTVFIDTSLMVSFSAALDKTHKLTIIYFTSFRGNRLLFR